MLARARGRELGLLERVFRGFERLGQRRIGRALRRERRQARCELRDPARERLGRVGAERLREALLAARELGRRGAPRRERRDGARVIPDAGLETQRAQPGRGLLERLAPLRCARARDHRDVRDTRKRQHERLRDARLGGNARAQPLAAAVDDHLEVDLGHHLHARTLGREPRLGALHRRLRGGDLRHARFVDRRRGQHRAPALRFLALALDAQQALA